jgi:protein-tyrosine phosphatase
VFAGGEVRLSSDIIDLMEQEQLPFLGTVHGYRILLLEFPYGQIPVGTEKLIRWLLAQKIRPLLAHPERNKVIMQNIEKLRPFIDMGCLTQVTAASLLGGFGPEVLNAAMLMLDRRWISVVATDAHNLLHRAPMMSEARAWLLNYGGQVLADELTLKMPAKVLGVDLAEDCF